MVVSTKERGCFDFMTKTKEDITEDVVITDLNAAEESKEENHTLMDELQRSHTHSTSSSDEEVEDGGERRKKKKKKGLKESIKEKISGQCSEDHENAKTADQVPDQEKKPGLLEKIKEKLPGGQHKKVTEEAVHNQTPAGNHDDDIDKEKKGIIDMIKDKLPGHHKINNEHHEVKKDI
ncbi:hypothetical protein DH2020_044731 [Rehmannia glutinosa]|uniref:Dehydrin n=1 Tax=Rehmannia glutinosa TaxID=99300 RepID=A0ABR0UH68_REHGL